MSISIETQQITAQLSTVQGVTGTLSIIGVREAVKYEGEYTVTPNDETQTLLTDGMLMDGNVTVNPIPSNYGLITWNGSTLTVS